MKKIIKLITVIGLVLIVIGIVSTTGIDSILKDKISLEKGEDIIDDALPKELMEKVEFTFSSKYYELFYKRKVKASQIPNAAKLSLAGQSYRRKNKSSYEMTKEEMKEELINIFGSNVKYKDEDFKAGACFADSMKIEDDKYKFLGGCSGLDTKTSYKTKIIKAVKKENSIEITEKIAYLTPKTLDIQNDKASYYIYDKKEGKLLGTIKEDEEFNIDDYLKDLKAYKFKFIKEEDNYYFDSVKEVAM